MIGGVPDITVSLIRRGLQPKGQPVRIDVIKPRAQSGSTAESSPYADSKTVSKCSDAATSHSHAYVPSVGENWDDYMPHMNDDVSIHGRTRSQVIMKTYGWPIKRALTPLEMVCAMRDAIAGEPLTEPSINKPLTRHVPGHRNAYVEGVLHRDISIGNIIITANPTPNNRGALIDFDNAIYYSVDRVPVFHDPLTVGPYKMPLLPSAYYLLQGTLPFMSAKLLRRE